MEMTQEAKLSLLQEIEKYSPKTPELLPDDLTIEDVAKHYNVSKEKARQKMKVIESASNGKFRLVDVKNPNGGNPLKVLRKVKLP